MIGGNVQEGRGVRLKRGCGVELKAADFQDQAIGLVLPVHQIHQRGADIAAHQGAAAGSLEHLTDKSGGGRLAIGAADGGHWQPQVTAGDFQFTDQGDAVVHRRG